MESEFERRFLIRDVPSDFIIDSVQTVSDLYWPLESDHAQLRLRQRDGKYEITKKLPASEDDLSHMIEYNIPLSKQEFEALSVVPGKRVSKERTRTRIQGALAEFGVFQGDLIGLIILDVEFSSKVEASEFSAPDYVIAEITNDKRFAGGELCGKSMKDIEASLSEYAPQ